MHSQSIPMCDLQSSKYGCDRSRILRIGDTSYFAYPSKHISKFKHYGESCLMTVIAIDRERIIDRQWLESRIRTYENNDDVFRKEFLEIMLFSGVTEDEISITEDAKELLTSEGMVSVEYSKDTIASGPYLVTGDHFWEICRLYEDFNDAFVLTLHPQQDEHFAELNVNYTNSRGVVAVPSRLRTERNEAKPLAGLRVVVKDNYDLEGVKTSLCSFAYRDTYPPRTKTAACIQILIDSGAIILAKSKLSSYVAPAFEEPVYCIDYPAPWNPRADGYQSPAGSSSGSGVAITSYEWADITLGSDTSGSGRRPGHWNGAFAIRPTHGCISLEGLPRCFPRFDTPTSFSRDIGKLRDFNAAWYGNSLRKSIRILPMKIIYPLDYMPVESEQHQIVIDNFLVDFEGWANVKHEKVSFDAVWDKNPPKEAGKMSLATYMKSAARDSYWYDHYHNLDDFRRDHYEIFHKDPYISPPVRDQWSKAAEVTLEERNEAMKRLDVYKQWFLSTIMQTNNYNTLIIMPIENLSPRYRDEQPPWFVFEDGVSGLMVSPIVGTPELVIPIDHVKYHSKVTGREEKLCCAVSVMGVPGSDMELMNLIQNFLKDTGRHTKVDTGKLMFPSRDT